MKGAASGRQAGRGPPRGWEGRAWSRCSVLASPVSSQKRATSSALKSLLTRSVLPARAPPPDPELRARVAARVRHGEPFTERKSAHV